MTSFTAPDNAHSKPSSGVNMSQFIVLGTYISENYEHEASCTGRQLLVAEVNERGLSFTGRTSYAKWHEGTDAISAADWSYCWYEVSPGDVITLATEDWKTGLPDRKKLVVIVPDGGLSHPPSTMEELRSCGGSYYYTLVSEGKSVMLESMVLGIGGLARGEKLSAEQRVKLVREAAAITGIAQEHIIVTDEGDEQMVTFQQAIPMAAKDTLIRQYHQALRRVDRRCYPTSLH